MFSCPGKLTKTTATQNTATHDIMMKKRRFRRFISNLSKTWKVGITMTITTTKVMMMLMTMIVLGGDDTEDGKEEEGGCGEDDNVDKDKDDDDDEDVLRDTNAHIQPGAI